MATVVTTQQRTQQSTIDELVATARKHDPRVDERTLREAYEFAAEAHAGQTRATGEPYVQHPLAVAQTIASLKLGTTAIVAALLHDVREDTTPQYYDQVAKRFGEAVNFLVTGVTRLSKVRKLRAGQGSVEDLRNIFLAMSRDIRVIIIKLADRLHNLETLYGLPSPKQRDVAQQTLDIYAPIADRLGMGDIKGQLEDLAFSYLEPTTVAGLRARIKDAHEERVKLCQQFQRDLRTELAARGLEVLDTHGRAKRLYSLHLKLDRLHGDLSQVYDLVAVRVIVPTLEDCYRALGVVHARWRPLVGKIKDYIATPKANGYQSLHTTVITGEGRFVEVQVRTPDMHDRAERGVAAAWAYADAKRHGELRTTDLPGEEHVAWVQQLARWQQDVDSAEEFFQTLRTDFFRNRIFCLTPAGEVVNLPEGATPIDFAYVVHTAIGHHAAGAKVNGAPRSLDYHLASGDLVEIVLSPEESPRREWLDFVKTSTARRGIAQWYRRLDDQRSREVGRALLTRELRELVGRPYETLHTKDVASYLEPFGYRDLAALEIAVGRGERNPRQVIKRVFADEILPTGSPVGLRRRLQLNVRVPDAPGAALVRAHCCRPIEGDQIVAVLVRGKAHIHRDECSQVALQGTPLAAAWVLDAQRTFRIWLRVTVKTHTGMLRDVTDVCAQQRIAIHDLTVRRTENGLSTIALLVELSNTEQLAELMRKLRSVPEVSDVARGR